MTVNSISSPDFKNSYARLPERFFAIQTPEPAANPELIRANTRLAEFLGVNVGWLESAEGIAALAGNITPDGAEPIAAAYAGHQFGNWNPQLGDGRAVLLGDFNAGKDHATMRRWMPADAEDALLGLDEQSRVDMIWVRGLKVESAWSSPAGPSDHPFFAARIRVAD